MNLGGTERSFLNLISALPKEYEIDLLLLENKGDLMKEIPSNVKVHTLDNNSTINEFLKYGNRNFALNELKRGNYFSAIKNFMYGVLFKYKLISHPFNGLSPYIKEMSPKYDYAVAYAGIHNFIAYYTLKHIKADKKFLWIHFDVSKISFNSHFASRFYKKFDKVLCVSKLVKENLSKVLKIDNKGKLEVYHNILNLKEIDSKSKSFKVNWDKEIVNILTVGRLSPEKGHENFLPVIKRLKSTGYNFKWWIIGEGNEMNSIRDLISKLDLASHVELLGKKENPFPYYEACDVYLQPSKYEGHCVSIIEAKYFNKPIVSNNFAGVTDEIQNEFNGLISEMNHDSQFIALEKIIKENNLRKLFIKHLEEESKLEFKNPFL